LIEDHRCQVIRSRVFYADSPSSSKQHRFIHLCLPRTRWADFLIYVVEDNNETPSISFFVIPTGDVVKSTSLCSPDSWVSKYKDTWSLLSKGLPTNRFDRRFQKFNWKLRFINEHAKSFGLKVELVSNSDNSGHLQNHVLLNGRSCQLMAAARLSADPNKSEWDLIVLHASKQTWAEFLIFILKAEESENLTFVFPRERIPKTTTTSSDADWLNEYAAKWELLKSSSEGGVGYIPLHE
jgi:hypothetical protein